MAHITTAEDGSAGARTRQRPGKRASLILLALVAVILVMTSGRLLLVAAGTSPTVWLIEFPAMVTGVRPEPEVAERARSVARLVTDPGLFRSLYGTCPLWPSSEDAGEDCLTVVDGGLGAKPASSELWLERARVLVRLGRMEAALEALRTSYRTGAHEGWIAGRRVVVALNLWDDLPEDLAANVRSDLRIVMSKPELSRRLANLFVLSELHRGLITSLLADLEPPVETDGFMWMIRQRMDAIAAPPGSAAE